MLATTVVPILCLLEWDSPKCSNHGLRVPAPKFPDKSRISGGFFSPILPSALTTSPPTPLTFLEELTSPIAKILSSTTTTTSTSTTVPSTTSDILTTKGFIPTTTRIIQELLLETQQPSTKGWFYKYIFVIISVVAFLWLCAPAENNIFFFLCFCTIF